MFYDLSYDGSYNVPYAERGVAEVNPVPSVTVKYDQFTLS